ncbi:MAG: SDR family NAD(P)-dependent oxidoreductase, partial [Clostridia bacterium]
MKSLWSDAEAARCAGPLEERAYSSRLLGRDKSLVLHGGGNTSVKLREKDLFGEERDVLYVKGSGSDLASIEPAQFVPLDLKAMQKLATLPALSDAQMMNELNVHKLRADAPSPSVETLLHALLPARYVDHTHADAVLAISNAPDGEKRLREIYGERVVIVPYAMAGFQLAALCAREFPRQAGKSCVGMVLVSHGILTFGDTAKQSYERMIELVSLAEAYLEKKGAWRFELPSGSADGKRQGIAALRREVSAAAGFPLVMRWSGNKKLQGFARYPKVAKLSQSGPATPDHLLYTKAVPMLGHDVAAYARQYRSYFERYVGTGKKVMLDPAPRVILDPDLGFLSAGRDAREAAVAEEIYDHTVDVILRAEALGGWRAVSEDHLFDVEYWELEQAKLYKHAVQPAFAGEVALVTGAASGIGRASVEAFLARGAAVVALDRNPAIEKLLQRPDFLGIACDLTDTAAIERALDAAVKAFGGLDMLVLNAGIFPATQPIPEIKPDTWRAAMGVNVEANLALLQRCHPLLKLAPKGGRVVVIGSRNVPAPGLGAAAYSASKAAMNQLARVA